MKFFRQIDLFIHKRKGRIDPTAVLADDNDCATWNEFHPEVPGGAYECIYVDFPHYMARGIVTTLSWAMIVFLLGVAYLSFAE